MLPITYHMPSCIAAPPSLQSAQFSSVAQSCPTLCDPMDCSMARPPCPSPTPGVSSFIVLSFCLFILLKARILKWFAIPFSSGPHSVRTQSLRGNESFRMDKNQGKLTPSQPSGHHVLYKTSLAPSPLQWPALCTNTALCAVAVIKKVQQTVASSLYAFPKRDETQGAMPGRKQSTSFKTQHPRQRITLTITDADMRFTLCQVLC